MRRYRVFNGESYERQNRVEGGTILNSPWYVKSDAQKEAKKRRSKGKKVRIIQSSNFKLFGGDKAFFLYQKLKGSK
jgi:hypothetical protein